MTHNEKEKQINSNRTRNDTDDRISKDIKKVSITIFHTFGRDIEDIKNFKSRDEKHRPDKKNTLSGINELHIAEERISKHEDRAIDI